MQQVKSGGEDAIKAAAVKFGDLPDVRDTTSYADGYGYGDGYGDGYDGRYAHIEHPCTCIMFVCPMFICDMSMPYYSSY